MAASLSVAVVNGAPGNVITIPGADLVPGDSATVSVANQGITDPPTLTSKSIVLPATFTTTNVTIGPLPDGLMSGPLTITAADGTTATCALRARSQYAQASEYIGEGVPTNGLATGELDVILQRASGIVDKFMGESLRLLQVLEQPKYMPPRQEMAPRLYPWRTSGRDMPITSVDQLTFVSAKDLITQFNIDDLYINSDLNYVEVLAYAIGNYALLGELQTIGYSANVFHLTYTSGFGIADYPGAIVDATIIVASELIKKRNLAAMNLGGVKSFEDKGDFETQFVMPPHARMLLKPYIVRAIA
jgi:hypothetical protein